MQMVRLSILTVWWLASWIGSVAAQDCRSCKGAGQKDCKLHKGVLELEQKVRHCSVAAACRKCAGALHLDCTRCEVTDREAAILQRRELVKSWRAGRQERIGQHTKGKNIHYLATENLDLTFSFKPMKVGKVKLDTHRLMHLYGERIEALRAKFVEVFELRRTELPARLEVLLLENIADHRALAPRVAGGSGGGMGRKLMGASAVFIAPRDRRAARSDADVHRYVVHNVAHLLLANMTPSYWFGNRKAGWVDAGVAHWFEWQLDERCSTFCIEEVMMQPGMGYKGGKWQVGVRKLLEAGQLVPFSDLYQFNTDQLELQHHAQAFAYVDFLLATRGGKKFAGFIRALKNKAEQRDALKDAFGLSPLQFDKAFHAWVRETYPLQKVRR